MFAGILLGHDGDGIVGMESGGGVVAVSAYIGGTCGSRVLVSVCDVLEMSVVRGVGGVCDMCMCMARGGRWWGCVDESSEFGLYQLWMSMGKVGYVSVIWLQWCGWCWGRLAGRLGPGSGRVVLCMCVL